MNKSGFSISIEPRLHTDALARMKKLKYVKQIDLRFRRREGPSPIDQKSSIYEFIQLRDKFDGATISVTIKPAKRETMGTGMRKLITDTASILQDGFAELTGAKIAGATRFDDENEADWQTIDLLRDKLHFDIEATENRFRNPHIMMSAIKRLWEEKRRGA